MSSPTKNYGLKLGAISPTDYFFGTLPKVVINSSKDYTKYLPTYEPQILPSGEDESGCHIWGTENCIETNLKCITGKDFNFSERIVYIGTNSDKSGGDPFQTGLWIKNHGLADEKVLPMTNTLAEFMQPNPLPQWILDECAKFGYEVKQEYVWNDYKDTIPLEEKCKRIDECLAYSALGVSVFAWAQDENGLYYRPTNAPDTHWCVLFKQNDNSYSHFDSYDQSIKEVRKDMNWAVCIRYYLVKKNLIEMSWWSKLIAWLKSHVYKK